MKPDLSALGDGLGPWLKRLGMGEVEWLFAIVAAWPGAAGDAWTTASEPAMLVDGELTVRVMNRASIRVLSYDVGGLTNRINEALEQTVVHSVRLVGSAPNSSSANMPKRL